MPSKNYADKKNFMVSVKEGITSIFDAVFLSFYSSVDRKADIMFEKFEERAIHMQQRLLWSITGAIVIGLSAVFLVSAVYFYMVEFQGISRTTSFLILAIILFIAGFYIKKTKGGVSYAKQR